LEVESADRSTGVQEEESLGEETERALRHERIARLAYAYWEARGVENGSADDDWFRAEAEIRRLEEG
jgi:hypothetical protein